MAASAVVVFIFGLFATQPAWCGEVRRFPEGFQFGAATAAYQVEGAWNVSDKSESIWDLATRTPGKIVDGSTGDIADDSYHQFRRDVEMARELGLGYYRFSIAWTRLVPNGFADKISEDGKRYYNELIDELLEHNITPMVTLYHWDLPLKLQELGGWANPLIVEWFEDYARVVFDLFADRVKLWITINEPLIVCGFGYGALGFGSALKTPMPGIGDFLCSKHVLLAHARAWRLFDEHYRPKYAGVAGLCNQLIWFEAGTDSEEDAQLAEEVNQLYNGLYSHPIFTKEGGWPQVVVERVAARSKAQGFPRSRLPEFSKKEIEYVKGTYDFYGFNHYTTKYVRRSDSTPWPMVDEIGADFYANPEWPKTESSWFQVNPIGIRRMLNFIKERYNSPRILITENGCSTGPGLQDDQRVQYYKDYLSQVLDAINIDGVYVTHYTAWSLMDNFEWNDGYTSRFGLYEVDYSDPKRARRARKSALVYKHIIATRSLDPDYDPESLDIAITPKKTFKQEL